MKISRQVGTVSEKLSVFVRDATNSSGAGLANVLGSSVSYSFWTSDNLAVSTGVASTAGSMGVYSTSAWVQISSSQALGWYQFGAPNGLFASGDTGQLHLYGAVNMAPLPVEVELTKTNNQQFASSTVFLAHTSTSPANVVQVFGSSVVTSGAGILNVSTQTLSGGAGNITQIWGQPIVTTAAGIMSIDLFSIRGSNAVTSSAGILTVSTQTLSGGAGNITQIWGQPIVTTSAGIMSINLSNIVGQPAVTSGAGMLNVSTQTIDKTGYSLGGTTFANVVQVYSQPVVTSAAGIFTVSTQTLSGGAGNITQIYGQPIVTSAAGVLNVSTQTLTVPDNVGIANISSGVLSPLAESYRANGATGTMAQLMYEMVSHMGEASIVNTTKTINKIDHASVAETFQLNSSSAPTAVSRIT